MNSFVLKEKNVGKLCLIPTHLLGEPCFYLFWKAVRRKLNKFLARKLFKGGYNWNYNLPLEYIIPPGKWGFSADFPGYVGRMAETIGKKKWSPECPEPIELFRKQPTSWITLGNVMVTSATCATEVCGSALTDHWVCVLLHAGLA